MKQKNNQISLFGLLKYKKFNWFLVLLLGVITLLSSIGLLSVSGWFITAAAGAGLLGIVINFFTPAALIRLFAITRTTGRYAEDLVAHNSVLELLKNLRVKTFHYLAKYRSKLYNTGSSSISVMHRLIVDIDRLDLFPLRFIFPWLWCSIVILLVLSIIYFISSALVLYILPGVLLAWLLIPLLSYLKGVRLAKEEVLFSEACKKQFIQSISLLTPLLLWKTWPTQAAELNNLNQIRLKKQLQQQNFTSLIAFGQQIALALALIGCLWQGFYLIQQGELTVPWLLAALLAIMGLFECLMPLAGSFISLGLSLQSRDRINELIYNNPVKKLDNNIEPEAVLTLVLKAVSGRIPKALNGPADVSFSLKQGDILCINGASGVGKTTLLDLIAGEIETSDGAILLNNRPINDWNLRNTLGYLQQQIDIFDASLEQNLRIGKQNASEEELWQVLDWVDLSTWAKKRNGLATPLGEYGAEVSGGQARRIALARLLLANRKLLLLDEPFAGLDEKSIALLFKQIKHYAEDKIVIIVSHHDLTAYGCQQYVLK